MAFRHGASIALVFMVAAALLLAPMPSSGTSLTSIFTGSSTSTLAQAATVVTPIIATADPNAPITTGTSTTTTTAPGTPAATAASVLLATPVATVVASATPTEAAIVVAATPIATEAPIVAATPVATEAPTAAATPTVTTAATPVATMVLPDLAATIAPAPTPVAATPVATAAPTDPATPAPTAAAETPIPTASETPVASIAVDTPIPTASETPVATIAVDTPIPTAAAEAPAAAVTDTPTPTAAAPVEASPSPIPSPSPTDSPTPTPTAAPVVVTPVILSNSSTAAGVSPTSNKDVILIVNMQVLGSEVEPYNLVKSTIIASAIAQIAANNIVQADVTVRQLTSYNATQQGTSRRMLRALSSPGMEIQANISTNSKLTDAEMINLRTAASNGQIASSLNSQGLPTSTINIMDMHVVSSSSSSGLPAWVIAIIVVVAAIIFFLALMYLARWIGSRHKAKAHISRVVNDYLDSTTGRDEHISLRNYHTPRPAFGSKEDAGVTATLSMENPCKLKSMGMPPVRDAPGSASSTNNAGTRESRRVQNLTVRVPNSSTQGIVMTEAPSGRFKRSQR